MRGPGPTLLVMLGAVALVVTGLIVLLGGVERPEGLSGERAAAGLVAPGGVSDVVPAGEDEASPESAAAVIADDVPPPIDPDSIPEGKSIRGVVKDAEGNPIARAVVRALEPVPRTSRLEEVCATSTAADGTFVVGPVDERVAVDAVAKGRFRARKWAKGGETVEFELGEPGILSGAITYDATGEPCDDVFLKLWHHDRVGGGEFTTDASGVYRFADLPPGRYRLSLMPARSPAIQVNDVEVKAGEETVRDLVVVRGVKVVGRVTDAETTQPVKGAEVRLQGNERLVATTDDDGRYELQGFGTERSRIGVQARGYLQAWANVLPRADGGDATCDVKLGKGGSVRGIVLGPSGEAVEGAKVVFNFWTFRNTSQTDFTLTDEEGRFLLEGVPPGKRVLYARAEGFATGVAQGLDVRVGAETSGVEIRLAVGGGISGKLTNVEGEPVGDVSVRIWSTTRSRIRIYPPEPVKSKEDGTFLFEHVRPGTYGAQVVAEDYQAELRSSIVVAEGAITPDVDFVLQKGTSIEGRVLSDDGKPIEGANIRAWPRRGSRRGGWRPVSGKSKADGSFRLLGLEAGTYYLNIQKAGFGNTYVPEVQTGTDALEVRLKEQGALTGSVVVGHGGPPAASAKVVVYMTRGQRTWAARTVKVADPKGKFSIKGLTPGEYQLEATTGSGMLSSRVHAEIREGLEPLPVTLVLGPGATITGVVLTPEGGPAKGASVQARPQVATGENMRPAWSQTDAEGRFVIRPLAAGNYILRAQHGQWSPCEELVALSLGGEVSVTLNLRMGGSFRIFVTDAEGQPVEGAGLQVTNSSGRSVSPNWSRYRQVYQTLRQRNPGLSWSEFYRGFTSSDESGLIERRFLSPDEYEVTVRAKGFQPGQTRILVRDGRETTRTVRLEPVPAAEGAPGGAAPPPR